MYKIISIDIEKTVNQNYLGPPPNKKIHGQLVVLKRGTSEIVLTLGVIACVYHYHEVVPEGIAIPITELLDMLHFESEMVSLAMQVMRNEIDKGENACRLEIIDALIRNNGKIALCGRDLVVMDIES